MTIERFGTTARYSDVVALGGIVYLVEVPHSLEADIATQVKEVLASIETLLAQAGSDKSKLVDVTIFLADIADYDGMNVAWDAWVDSANPPARATIEARLANAAWKVEIKVVASR